MLDYIRDACLNAKRVTAFVRAFRAALGIEQAPSTPDPIQPRISTYEGLDECFDNKRHINF